MKDDKFIELLNLYVDHQITPEGAAELESEIQGNPARRKTYQDYCRMQRACGMILENGRRNAPVSFALERSVREIERRVASRETRRSAGWRPYATAFGGLAAMAACIAVALVHTGGPTAAGRGDVALAAPAVNRVAQVSGASAQFAALLPRAGVSAETALLAQNSMPSSIVLQGEAPAWMRQVQLPPAQRVLADGDAFKGQSALNDNNRVFTSGHPFAEGTEFTAFEFAR